MAKSILEYWSGSAWVQAKTVNASTNAADQENAVIRVEINDRLNNPRTANITLINAGRKPFGSSSDRYGPLNDVFTDFMTIRIVEDDSKVVLFQGKLYDVDREYSMQWGNVIKLYARDNLAELADYPTDDKDEPISSTDSDRTSAQRSDIIKTIIRDSASEPHMASLMISANNIDISDAQKFTDSSRTFSHDGDTYEFVVSSGGKQGLKAIGKIAANDGHNAGEVENYGYDFYVDTQQALGASNPAMDFNYFKRGSRTTHQATATNFDGLTVEYPVAAFTETGNKTAMLPGFQFDQPKRDLYTGAVIHVPWETEGENNKTTTENRALEVEVLEGNISSEFLHAKDNSTNAWKLKTLARSNDTVTAPENFADYLWKLGAEVATGALVNMGFGMLDGVNNTTITVDGTQDPTIKAGEVIIIDTENMYVTETTPTRLTVIRAWGTGHSSYSAIATHANNSVIKRHNIVGRLQYQSTNSGEGFILISFERDTSGSKIINTQRKNFEAIATGDSDITLTNGNDHFVFNPSTERVANKWGIKRLLRVSNSEAKNINNLRKNLAASLKGSKTTRSECSINTMVPPFIHIETYAASAASTTQIVLTDSSANRNAFDIGLRNGMSIAKVSAVGKQTAYGYVTAIADTDSNTATVTAALDTGDWDGYTGSGNKLRFYIPVRAGHYIYAKNTLVNFEGYMFVQEIKYTEDAGVQQTYYKGTGVNSAGDTIATGLDPNVIVATIEGESGKLMDRSTNPPKGGSPFKFRPTADTGTAIFAGTSSVRMGWTAGELVVGQQSRYPISAGNTGDMSTSADAITGFPVLYVIYFDPDQVPTTNGRYAFSNSVESSYNADANHIFIGHARAAVNAATHAHAKAVFIRDGTGMGFFGNSNDGVGENSFSAAMFKPSLQPCTTDINFYPGNSSNASKFRYIHASKGAAGSSTHGEISFADNSGPETDGGITLNYNNSIDLTAANSITSYIYFRLVDSGGTETSILKDVDHAEILRTATYSDATSDSRGLLAICATGANAVTTSPYDEVAIQAFHGKGLNINADVIAANAIVADAIQADALDAHTITLTGGGKFITSAGAVRDGTNNYLSTNFSSPSAGVLIDQYGIIGNSGGTGAANVQFYMDADDGKIVAGAGQVSLGSAGIVIGGSGTTGFLRFTAPDEADAFIYRVQSSSTKGNVHFTIPSGDGTLNISADSINGGASNTTELGSPNFSWFNKIYTERVNFESNNSAYEEFATIEGPENYDSADSDPITTARYVIILPTEEGAANEVFAIASLSGTTMTTAWAADATSSLRYKENITALNIDTEKIFNLVPKAFTWKEEMRKRISDPKGSDRPSFGYIAEEVEEFLPEILGYDAENKPKQLDYKLLSVLLLEELKKLKTRVEILEGG